MTNPPKRPRDVNQLAQFIGEIATGERPDDAPPSAHQMRAAKGGEARAKKLSRQKRLAIARKGGKASAKVRKGR